MGSHSAGRHSRSPAPRSQAAARIPPRPPFAPPGELDTLTSPLSVSTTARQARQSAPAWDGHAAARQQRDRGEDPTDPMRRAPVGRGWPRHDRLAADDGNTDDRYDDDRFDTDDQYDTDNRYDTNNRYEADKRYDSDDSYRYDDDDQYGDDDRYRDERWSDSPAHGAVSWERGSHFAGAARVVSPSSGASFAASRMPTTGRMPVGPRRGRPAPAAARDRLAGRAVSPRRRGGLRGRRGAGGTAVPNAGKAPRIQYTGGTEAFAYGAAQTQASRDRALSTPPRAELAPSADQAGTGSSGSGSSSGGRSAGRPVSARSRWAPPPRRSRSSR